jgi:flagellar basal body-associated protein FliL
LIETNEDEVSEQFEKKKSWIYAVIIIFIFGIGIEAAIYFLIKIQNSTDRIAYSLFSIDAIFKSIATVGLAYTLM